MKRKVKRGVIIAISTVLIFVVLVIAFISPIAKYLIEKYDVKYLGREIKISWLYLNPFTGYIYIHGLKVYEPNSDSTILTADGLSAKYEILKTFKKTYEISSITLTRPVGYIILDGKILNFSDLIVRFSPKEKRDTTLPHTPVHFNILGIRIIDGEFHYIQRKVHINYFVKKVNIESSGKWWNVDSMIISYDMLSGPGSGEIKGKGSINFANLRYRMATTVTKFDIELLNQYLHALSNYGQVAAFLDADVKAEGSFIGQLDLNASGLIKVSDFHFGKKAGDDFASFDRLVLDATEINPRQFQYLIDSITVAHPFFKYERYDHLDNIEMMFGENGALVKQAKADKTKFNLIIEIGKFVEKLGKNFLQSHYSVGKVAIYNGDVAFNDFSLREKFSIKANPLYLRADSLDKNNNRITAWLTSGIYPYGSLAASLSLNPENYGYFDLRYTITKVPITLFNPYVISYTSFPLDRGRLDFTGYMSVKDSNINSQNHLIIVDPRVAKREKKKDTKWIPLPFIMSLIRSAGNAIDFSIPIHGNLSKPKFKIWEVVDQVLLNIIVKPPSSAYLIEVKNVEKEVEKSLTVEWRMHEAELSAREDIFIERMGKYLKNNPNATITVTPMLYEVKEKEHILLYEAKKKFVMQTRNIKTLTENDSIALEKMSVKDSQFVHYLNRFIPKDSIMNTIQEKCQYVIGQKLVDEKYLEMEKGREAAFTGFFGDAASRVRFNKAQTVIPFNGFSYYEINYDGGIPAPLTKAYNKLEKLDNKPPREKYKDKRKTTEDSIPGIPKKN